jgi:transcriptional regulator with XRE-family HTH domain
MPKKRTPAHGGVALGKWLRALRLQKLGKRNSLDSAVARLQELGIDTAPTTIWNYEHGRTPDPTVLIGLAAIYGVDQRDFFRLLAPPKLGNNIVH